MAEELSGGDERDRPDRRWPAAAAVAVILVVIGLLATNRAGNDSPTPSPSPSRPGAPGRTFPVLPDRVERVGEVCSRTDHEFVLDVSFGLTNTGKRPLRVSSVSPVLPLGGLTPSGGSIGVDECGEVAGRDGDTLLRPGESLAATLRLALPDECPLPFPVQAAVLLIAPNGRQTTQQVTVLGDLGGLGGFRQCRDTE